jgi:hypothetical protein
MTLREDEQDKIVSSDTIKVVKEKLTKANKETYGDRKLLKIVYNGKTLDDDRTLSDYGLVGSNAWTKTVWVLYESEEAYQFRVNTETAMKRSQLNQ